MKYINANLDKRWNWYNISCNPNITMDDIRENPDKQWDWEGISCNPNITMNDIKENPDKPWRWDRMSFNPFTKAKQDFITNEYRRYLAAYRIQQWWHQIQSDPRHPLGIRRLEREYAKLFGPVPDPDQDVGAL